MKNKKIFLVPVVALSTLMVSCGTSTTNQETSVASNNSTWIASQWTIENTTNQVINTASSNSTWIVSQWTTGNTIKTYSNWENITLTNESISITSAWIYTITWTLSNWQILVDAWEDQQVVLNLNWVNITNSTWPAIYVKSWKATINLNWENTLTDGKNYSNTSEDTPNATLYSEEDLKITWTWTLKVTANYADAIASKDDLIIENWSFIINSADDAIRWKDSLQILDWNFNIISGWDWLKSTNETNAAKWYIHIKWWKFEISANSDGIQAVTKVTIDWWEINIKNSTEGIEATQVYINSWKITLNSSDDGINAAQKWLSNGSDILISISGWDLDITMAAGDTDAFDSNWDLIISGWNINIKAQFAFDFDGKSSFTWWNITVNWEKVTTITNSMMWGGRWGMWWGRGGMWWVRPW